MTNHPFEIKKNKHFPLFLAIKNAYGGMYNLKNQMREVLQRSHKLSISLDRYNNLFLGNKDDAFTILYLEEAGNIERAINLIDWVEVNKVYETFLLHKS